MTWLNYHHLHYFWVVAHEGSIAKATKKLHLTQPTISAQLRLLEESLGEKLFEKAGRGLVLTEAGRVTLRYADEIFALGRELRDTLRDRPTGKPVRVSIGIADVVPKVIAYRVLRAAFEGSREVEMVCREGPPSELLQALAHHEVDLVLSDAPAAGGALRAFNHLLGESGTSWFAAPAVAASLGAPFPQLLEGAPVLLPSRATQIRRALELWFDATDIHPRRVGEFDDLALMTAFGRAGTGIFPAPSIVEHEIEAEYGVRVVGRLPDVKERFYAIAAERKIKNPLVSAITGAVRRETLEGGSRGGTR